ncbi:MAG: MBL fold metallo-hydrolase [Bacteroidales bacterium]|nr:MBL fold metallo-hydrolase [Bacteroidales bacterium]
MKIHLLKTGNFMLDGGAMFGVVPKTLWSRVYPANELNLCNLSLRCLLVETGNRLLLFNAGIGNKQDEKFLRHYYLNGDDTLEKSLSNAGYRKEDVTDLILTHLHFDHCGGAVEYNHDKTAFQTTFPNAVYHVSKSQWDWMLNPNRREKVSFLKENIEPIAVSGQLKLFENNFSPVPEITLRLYNGHSTGMAVPFIKYNDMTLVYTTDLLPTTANIPLSWVCGFDTQPLLSLTEHEEFLNEALAHDYVLVFEHDLYTECCRLEMTEKGIRGNKSFNFKQIVEIPFQ